MCALGITYTGKLGFELHLPVEFAVDIYETVMAAGEPHGIANAGYRAIESLRLEKGYRGWASDIPPNDTPLEAALSSATKLGTNVAFLGREELERQTRDGANRRIVALTVDDPTGGER